MAHCCKLYSLQSSTELYWEPQLHWRVSEHRWADIQRSPKFTPWWISCCNAAALGLTELWVVINLSVRVHVTLKRPKTKPKKQKNQNVFFGEGNVILLKRIHLFSIYIILNKISKRCYYYICMYFFFFIFLATACVHEFPWNERKINT